jgi:ParB-like chromosome segregation protein Spo0J
VSLEIRVLPLGRLKPAPYNPRRPLSPKSPAYRKLRASLTEFGLVEPLVWNERTGHVVGGHLRLAVLRELGTTEVPVSVVRLDDAGEKALNVVLNNREAQGRYDPAKLADLLEELDVLGTLDRTGFDADALAALRLRPVPDLPPEAEAGRVEVTLVTDPATFEHLSPKLDAVVAEFDLVTHVRRT